MRARGGVRLQAAGGRVRLKKGTLSGPAEAELVQQCRPATFPPARAAGRASDQRLRVRIERLTEQFVCGAGVKRGDCSWCSGACRWTWYAPATLRRR
jgi:hypothetical protein